LRFLRRWSEDGKRNLAGSKIRREAKGKGACFSISAASPVQGDYGQIFRTRGGGNVRGGMARSGGGVLENCLRGQAIWMASFGCRWRAGGSAGRSPGREFGDPFCACRFWKRTVERVSVWKFCSAKGGARMAMLFEIGSPPNVGGHMVYPRNDITQRSTRSQRSQREKDGGR